MQTLKGAEEIAEGPRKLMKKLVTKKFVPPKYPAYLVTDNFQSKDMQKLQDAMDEHYIQVGMQTGKKKLGKLPDTPLDRFFIVADDSKGKPKLEGQFDDPKYKIVYYPKKNNIKEVIREYKDYVGLGQEVITTQIISEEQPASNKRRDWEQNVPSGLHNAPAALPVGGRLATKLKTVGDFKSKSTNKLEKGENKLFVYTNPKDSDKYKNYVANLQARTHGNERVIFLDKMDGYQKYARNKNNKQNHTLMVGDYGDENCRKYFPKIDYTIGMSEKPERSQIHMENKDSKYFYDHNQGDRQLDRLGLLHNNSNFTNTNHSNFNQPQIVGTNMNDNIHQVQPQRDYDRNISPDKVSDPLHKIKLKNDSSQQIRLKGQTRLSNDGKIKMKDIRSVSPTNIRRVSPTNIRSVSPTNIRQDIPQVEPKRTILKQKTRKELKIPTIKNRIDFQTSSLSESDRPVVERKHRYGRANSLAEQKNFNLQSYKNRTSESLSPLAMERFLKDYSQNRMNVKVVAPKPEQKPQEKNNIHFRDQQQQQFRVRPRRVNQKPEQVEIETVRSKKSIKSIKVISLKKIQNEPLRGDGYRVQINQRLQSQLEDDPLPILVNEADGHNGIPLQSAAEYENNGQQRPVVLLDSNSYPHRYVVREAKPSSFANKLVKGINPISDRPRMDELKLRLKAETSPSHSPAPFRTASPMSKVRKVNAIFLPSPAMCIENGESDSSTTKHRFFCAQKSYSPNYTVPQKERQPHIALHPTQTVSSLKKAASPIDLSKYDKFIENGLVVYRPKRVSGETRTFPSTINTDPHGQIPVTHHSPVHHSPVHHEPINRCSRNISFSNGPRRSRPMDEYSPGQNPYQSYKPSHTDEPFRPPSIMRERPLNQQPIKKSHPKNPSKLQKSRKFYDTDEDLTPKHAKPKNKKGPLRQKASEDKPYDENGRNRYSILYLVDRSLADSAIPDIKLLTSPEDSIYTFKNPQQLHNQIAKSQDIYDLIFVLTEQVISVSKDLPKNVQNCYFVKEDKAAKPNIRKNMITINDLKDLEEITRLLMGEKRDQELTDQRPSRDKPSRCSYHAPVN